MPVYELSIDPAVVAKAEAATSLDDRGFPTLVMRWESFLFGQPWTTTLVLDYQIALPPLLVGQTTFNEVRLAAFTGGAPTKFMYFGTELNASVHRVAPEMENTVAPQENWQEFRLDEQSSPVPYLKLITTTPRIYGNGPQDYYAPAIKVERYDAIVTPDLLGDMFPQVVAGLDPVRGPQLADPERGIWAGARYVGITKIAILRSGVPVGLHVRAAKPERDVPPPDVKRRDPKKDIRPGWVGVDIGTASCVVAARNPAGGADFIRVGDAAPPTVSAENENPMEVSFGHLGRTLKAWRERVILPLTRWGDVTVGHAAKGGRGGARALGTVTSLPTLRARIQKKVAVTLAGADDPQQREALKKPAPPVIDEDGIGAHDPFDPFELYAYYVGLHVNHPARGIFTKYAVSMPAGWPKELRESVLVSFRRGVFRSLPAGMLEFHDLAALEVEDVGPSALAVGVHGTRTFGIVSKGEPIPVGFLDLGASETGILFGHLRPAKPSERDAGLATVVEHLDPDSVGWFGAEKVLHRLAQSVYVANEAALADARVPFDPPEEERASVAAEDLFNASAEGRANALLLRDHLRPLLLGGGAVGARVELFDEGGALKKLELALDKDALGRQLEELITAGCRELMTKVEDMVSRLGKDPNPYEGFRIVLGGRLGLHAKVYETLRAAIPEGASLHRYREPEKSNLGAPTVKMAAALGAIALRMDRIGAVTRAEKRGPFRYRVGRARHGQLSEALTPSSEYDAWFEAGASNKPVAEILYLRAEDEEEVAADDPRVERAACELGDGAIGQRLYLRAVGPQRVEVAVGPPGGEPDLSGPRVSIDFKTGAIEPC